MLPLAIALLEVLLLARGATLFYGVPLVAPVEEVLVIADQALTLEGRPALESAAGLVSRR